MQKPAYKVKIGSVIFDSTANPEILSIGVDLDMDVPSDSFNIALKLGTKASSIKNGDAIVIELGYEGALTKVLTGSVDTIEPKISELVVSGYSAVIILTIARINQVYEKQTAGEIIKDIASKAGIAVKDVEDGLSFPMYVIDDTKDGYTHMRELARKCGFDLFLTGDGRLVFKKYAKQTPRPFKYGRDIIEAEVYEPTLIAACVKVYGESPSSFKGADTSHWISKKVVEGIAGSGSEIFLIEDPTVRDKDTADKAAASYLETIMAPLSGTLKSLGNARVGLGDTIEIKDMPDSRMNGEFEATSINHIFNKNEGFVSVVGWIKKIKISSTAPPLAAPPPVPAPPKPPSPLEEQLESAKGDLEDKRLRLQDAVENAEMELEKSQFDINKVISEMEKLAREMIEAAEDAKKAAIKGAKEALAKVDELKKELEARKKEIEDGLAEARVKFEEFKKEAFEQIKKYEKELLKLKEAAGKLEDMEKEVEEKKEIENLKKESEDLGKEADEKIKEVESKKEGIKKSIEDAEKEFEKKVADARKKIDEITKEVEVQIKEAKKTAERIEKEADEKLAEAKKRIEETKKEALAKLESVKKAYNKAREKVMEARKQAGMD